jgi:hypothetical protein
MTYETISIDQLNNRASNAYFRGDCGIPGFMGKPEIPDQFYSIQYWNKDRQVWWNGDEQIDEEAAIASLNKIRRLRGESDTSRIQIVVAKQPEPIEEVQEVPSDPEQKSEIVEEEQSSSTNETNVDEQPVTAQSGTFEVVVEQAGKPTFVAYRGDSLAQAKATVASHMALAQRTVTRLHFPEGTSWVYPGKRANGLAWDRYKQWLDDLHAGKFNDALMKDHLNEMMDRGRMSGAEAEAEWNAYQERNASHASTAQ